VCCCNWWALTLRTFCLNTEWAMGIWHSWLKHLNCWWKAVKNLICYSCIFHAQLHVHLKKWTLKFKLLYPRNYISYFNKISRICWVNICIQSLKVWRKFVLPWLKYNIFARGLFFIGAPCISASTSRELNVQTTPVFTCCGFVHDVMFAHWAHSRLWAIAVPSVTRCRCCRCHCGHRCAGGVRQ